MMRTIITILGLATILSGCGESETRISKHYRAMIEVALMNCETYNERDKRTVCLDTLERKVQEAMGDDMVRNPQHSRW